LSKIFGADVEIRQFEASEFTTEFQKNTLATIEKDVAKVMAADRAAWGRITKLINQYSQLYLPKVLYSQGLVDVCNTLIQVPNLHDDDILLILHALFMASHRPLAVEGSEFANVLTKRLLRYHGVEMIWRPTLMEAVSTFLSRYSADIGARMIDIILAAGLEAEYAIYILVLKAFVTSTVQPNDPVGIKNFITSNFQSFLRSAESLYTSQSYHSDVSQLSGQTRTPDEWADWIFSPLSVQGPDVVRRYMIVDIWQAVSFRNESPLVNDVVKESERNAIDAFVQTFKVEENRKMGNQI
jgi:hypothetical protein